jgi:hypothetical protein
MTSYSATEATVAHARASRVKPPSANKWLPGECCVSKRLLHIPEAAAFANGDHV